MLKNGDNTSVSIKKTAFRKWYRDFFLFLQKIQKAMDYNATIIGRQYEQDLIREYYNSPKDVQREVTMVDLFKDTL